MEALQRAVLRAGFFTMTMGVIDPSRHPLVNGCPPQWVSGWGQDRFGVFVDLTLEEVTQRLRWIPPGRFTMGSPGDEPGRGDNEGPCHDVMIGDGYWLFDTPVTQALWQAVMGEYPSGVKSAEHPVEQISWQDAQAFIERINNRMPGLELCLPSEAQWEYACRAGGRGAIFEGEFDLVDGYKAPALDGIAWYGGNSGEGFDFDEVFDSTVRDEKQFPPEGTGTRVVGLKRPNGWGLYDMLGNVWEWCEDEWHKDYWGAPSDGSPWVANEASAYRVVRGGAWNAHAGSVRSACRDRLYHLERRHDIIGFRCARVQE